MPKLWVIGIEEDDGDGEDYVDRTYVDYHFALSAEGPLLCSYTGKRISSEQVTQDMDLWETWPCSECMVVLASSAKTAEARVAKGLRLAILYEDTHYGFQAIRAALEEGEDEEA